MDRRILIPAFLAFIVGLGIIGSVIYFSPLRGRLPLGVQTTAGMAQPGNSTNAGAQAAAQPTQPVQPVQPVQTAPVSPTAAPVATAIPAPINITVVPPIEVPTMVAPVAPMVPDVPNTANNNNNNDGGGGGGPDIDYSNTPCNTRVTHTVRAGENLFRIALRYRTTAAAVARMNGITNVRRVSVGQRLRIVACARGYSNPRVSRGASYVVQPGDTIFRIALRYGVNVQYLCSVNGLYSNLIVPGQTLIIP